MSTDDPYSAPATLAAAPATAHCAYDFAQVDVFAENPLEGNALAIFTDARGLSTAEMQALARETNLSETTFILPRASEIERDRGVQVRIFLTTEEVPFAGHPTLGTASWLYWNHQSCAAQSKSHSISASAPSLSVSYRRNPANKVSSARCSRKTQPSEKFATAERIATRWLQLSTSPQKTSIPIFPHRSSPLAWPFASCHSVHWRSPRVCGSHLRSHALILIASGQNSSIASLVLTRIRE